MMMMMKIMLKSMMMMMMMIMMVLRMMMMMMMMMLRMGLMMMMSGYTMLIIIIMIMLSILVPTHCTGVSSPGHCFVDCSGHLTVCTTETVALHLQSSANHAYFPLGAEKHLSHQYQQRVLISLPHSEVEQLLKQLPFPTEQWTAQLLQQ